MVESAYFVESAAGLLLLDPGGGLLGSIRFRDASDACDEIGSLVRGSLGPLARGLLSELSGKVRVFVFEDSLLAADAARTLSLAAMAEQPSLGGRLFRAERGRYLSSLGLQPSELAELLRSVSLELARRGVSEASSGRDRSIVQSVNLLDELDKSINALLGRLREWYSLHFPELWRAVPRTERFTHLVRRLGSRSGFTAEAVVGLGFPREFGEELSRLAEGSAGAELGDAMQEVVRLAEVLADLQGYRERVAGFVERMMEEVAPNLKAVAGSSVGARLTALAGGLQNLAKMPSSTIQVLGAEKALFRARKTGAKPPKHGVIFQHPLVHGSPRRVRGKVSRALAGKIAIAARVDAFSGGMVGERLSKELEDRVREVREAR